MTIAAGKVRRLAGILAGLSMVVAAAGARLAHAGAGRTAHTPAKTHVAANAKTKTKVKAKAKAKAATKGKGGTAAPSRAAKPAPPQPPPMVGGRVAVFAFKGEDGSMRVRSEVVNLLRSKGLNVMTTLLPVDSAEQYRDMAATLGLAVYVHGEVRDNGDRAKAVVHIRSGVTGRKIKSARFSGASTELPDDVGRSLWAEVGPSFLRTCAAAAKPRKGGRAPMRIEAGTPLGPSDTQGT